MPKLIFEWSSAKAVANNRKHRVSFEEASTVFGDVFSRTIYDPDHSADEHRFITIGRSAAQRVLVVVHTEIVNRIRLISARKPTRTELAQYENEAGETN